MAEVTHRNKKVIIRTYDDVEVIDKPSIKTGNPVLDNFLSNNVGFQLGNLIMMTGTSGAGKTTLCKMIQRVCPQVSVFHALESLASSVKRQTDRIKTHDNAYITDETDFPDFDEFMVHLYDMKPTFVMVDSLQHASKQLKKKYPKWSDKKSYQHVLSSLYKWKDVTQGVVILICQLTKDGIFEGPSGMLFDADAQIHLEFSAKTKERTMETFKNRMGELDKIFYEFNDSPNAIDFFTEDEWEIIRKNVTLPEIIEDTIKRYFIVHKNSVGFPEFKKEYSKRIRVIDKGAVDDFDYISKAVTLIGELFYRHIEPNLPKQKS